MVTGILTPTQSIAVVLAAMVALVVISSLLEGRTPQRGEQPRHPPSRPARRGAAGAAARPREEALAGAPAASRPEQREPSPATTVAHEEQPTVLARVDRPGGTAVQLGAPGAEGELAAVLFAAYVASGGAERARVTGWVAPAGQPPSLPELHDGEHLRGRPGRVTALLGCRDGGRNWVALDPDTDIALGLTRRPPTDERLRGIAWWWTLAVGKADAIPPEHAGVVREGVEAVAGALKGHPLAATARGLAGVAAEAERLGAPIVVRTLSAEEFRRRRRGPAAGDGDRGGSGDEPGTSAAALAG